MVLVLDSLLYPLLKPTHSLQAHRVGFCLAHSAKGGAAPRQGRLPHVLSTSGLLTDCPVAGSGFPVSIGLAIGWCDTYTTGVGVGQAACAVPAQ
jgi:hypothetical protein